MSTSVFIEKLNSLKINVRHKIIMIFLYSHIKFYFIFEKELVFIPGKQGKKSLPSQQSYTGFKTLANEIEKMYSSINRIIYRC